MLIITDERCVDYHREGHPERPQRVSATLEGLREQNDLELHWATPAADPTTAIGLAHPEAHVERLVAPPADFDADTPAHPGILGHASRSVAAALDAVSAAESGTPALSLMRPPGHHACSSRPMGFCYLNQAAICALKAAAEGKRAAVFDFDVHHGNGTDSILRGVESTLYASAHQWPAFPGTGRTSRDNCRNHPVAPSAPRADFVAAVHRAFDDITAFNPDLIIVSAGFDAYRGDPLAQENLAGEDFHDFGRLLRDTGKPVASILEGGYSKDLPALVLEYLKGLSP